MKRILIITYYWPPSGGIGVLRCLKFAKYLHKMGHQIIIYTTSNGHYPYIDFSNDKDIPKGIEILKTKIWEPYSIYKFITGKKKNENVNNVFSSTNDKRGLMYHFSVWLRSNFFIPDARAFWINKSVKFLNEYLKKKPVDIVISNGPPHTNTRIACQLKKGNHFHWHADFQDPWTQVDYFSQLHLTKRSLKKHLQMEQDVFNTADTISIVSNNWKKDLESIGAKNVNVIEWGYDEDDYKQINRIPDIKFSITHSGIWGFDRNAKIFFQVLKEIINENIEFKTLLEIKVIGELDVSVLMEIKKCNLEPYVNNLGFVNRKLAIQESLNSQILLLLLNQQNNAIGRIPGKLFEYLALQRPIIVLGPGKCDSGDIVTKTKSGDNFNYDDFEGIKKCILYYFNKFKLNQNEILQENTEYYTNKKLTDKLMNQIEDKID